MNSKPIFIHNGFPLTNRIWIEMRESTTKDMVLDFIGNHIRSIPEAINLEVHIYVNEPTEQTNNNIEAILNEVYQFKVGYEKSFPIVSIYYPYESLNKEIINTINKCDQYRPGIRFYIVVKENQLPEEVSLSMLREMSQELFEWVIYSQNIGLDTTLLFSVEKETKAIEQFLELRRITYTWDTSVELKKPLLQVSPKVELREKDILLLSKYIDKEEGLLPIFDIMCGYTTMFARYNENRKIPTNYVPLGGCGTGISENKLCFNGGRASCYYMNEILKEDALEVCKECEYVTNCTGCLFMISNNEDCKLKKTLDFYEGIIQ